MIWGEKVGRIKVKKLEGQYAWDLRVYSVEYFSHKDFFNSPDAFRRTLLKKVEGTSPTIKDAVNELHLLKARSVERKGPQGFYINL